MKTIVTAFAFLLVTASFAQVTENRTPGDFTGIRASSAVDIELSQGDACAVTVRAGDQKDIGHVKTEVKDGILAVSYDDLKMMDDDDIKVLVTVKTLRTLEMSGASQLKTTNQLTTDSLSVETSGAAQANVDVKASSVRATLSGASEVHLSGTSDRLMAVTSGASELKAYDLAANSVLVSTSGASEAHVTANNSIDATASGASEVHYQGDATEKRVNVAGHSATIAQRNKKDGGESDTTKLRVGDYNVNITENKDKDDERSKREKHNDDSRYEFWSGIDFGVNGYTTIDNKLDLPPGQEFLALNYAKSYMFGMNLFQHNIHIYRNNVNLGTGIGLTWYHYNFRNSYSLQPDMSYATAVYDSVHYTKNRLNMCYANIPLFLEFNTNNNDANNSFHIGGGLDFGYNIFHNKLKQKYEIDGHDYKRKVVNDFNVNPFRYDIIARVGYGKFTIFGTYALSTLFEKNHGPVVYPFSAGIHIDF